MPNAIETVDLVRRYRRTEAVNGLNLQVPEGSIFALIGPNGAGKTTTIKMLMNLVRPSRGSASVLGTDSRRLGAREFERIGYISENQTLPQWMTPRQLFDYCRPLYPTWDDHLCRKLQSDLGLTADTALRTLSRGTRMKAALLSSLAYRPDLVVLDEPFTGLDPLVRDELVQGLLEVSGERGWTVLVSSHDIEEVERLADRVGFIDRGRLLFAEPVASLLERFRLVEVIADDGTPAMPSNADWLLQGTAARTLRFVETRYGEEGGEARLAAAFPGSEIRVSPMSLREIFIALARRSGSAVSS